MKTSNLFMHSYYLLTEFNESSKLVTYKNRVLLKSE